MRKNINIPIFIPYLGCGHDCVFCNQKKITGHGAFDPTTVRDEIERALSTITTNNAEIAFFGGSFTGIDRETMLYLLDLGYGYIKSGRVSALRCSTRPDYIDDEILSILAAHGMKTVELGIQSTDDGVLKVCKRGHTASQALESMRAVKRAGFALVGQMMTGLPSSDAEKEIKTARDICECGADGARIYPTVVFSGTELASMAQRGEYITSRDDEVVKRAAAVKRVFIENGVAVIRVGLQAADNLCADGDIACGGYMPATGELCDAEIYRVLLEEALNGREARGCHVTAYVASGHTSRAVGQHRSNILYLTEKFSLRSVKVIENAEMPEYKCRISVTSPVNNMKDKNLYGK